jgi:mannose-6-phosphate isomerase-like protein (cupin superfamily)
MNSIQKSNANSFSNGPTCTGYEYSFGDKDMNIAVVTVNGRYPETGYVMNEVCKEVGYVLSGRGSISVVGGDMRNLETGDAVMIQPGEKFFWQGDSLEMLMPCSPAFYPEQYKIVE